MTGTDTTTETQSASSIEQHNDSTNFPKHKIKFTTYREDGLGAQLRQIMECIAFARKHPQFEFYYHPLHGHAHGVNMREMDQFMNIGSDQKPWEPSMEPILNLNLHRIINDAPSYYYDDALLSYVKSLHNTTQPVHNCSDFNIGVHIRRGDTIHSSNHRLLADDYYVHIMKEILYQIETNHINELKNDIVFNIYSERNLNVTNLNMLIQQNIVYQNRSVSFKYHIDISVKDTIYSLIDSDALILSKSSFSYIPALLSSSKYIYYAAFWHRPVNGWIVVKVDERFGCPKWRECGRWWEIHNCSDIYKRIDNNIKIYQNVHCNILLANETYGIKRIVKHSINGQQLKSKYSTAYNWTLI
eukprot:58067_1